MAKVNPSIISNLQLHGKRFTPQDALDAGLVDAIADSDILETTAIDFAENSIGAKDRLTYGRIKHELYKTII
jgi:enoyl-CoA hydratase/carnithine racemase